MLPPAKTPTGSLDRWRFAAREHTRSLSTRLLRAHRPGDAPDIAIVSSPRSGSTWLMEALSDQPRYKYINEPDHKTLLEFHHALRIPARWNWLCLDETEKADLSGFLRDDRRSGLFGPARPWDALRHWPTSRRVLKLVRMNALIDWLGEIGFQTVYLVRHPIAQSLSCIARGHEVRLTDFLDADCFRELLSVDQVQAVTSACESDDPLEQFVMQWCLENLIPLRSLGNGASFPVSAHEIRILDGRGEALRLAAALGVPNPQRMLAHAAQPSRVTNSSSAETVSRIRAGRSRELLGAWRTRIAPARESALMQTLPLFGIDVYRPGDDLPHLDDR